MACLAAADGTVHVVRRGETLSIIAARYGTTIAELRSLNGISSRSSLIQVGQTLRVAPAAAANAESEPQAPPESAAANETQTETLTHVVKRGETLSSIAAEEYNDPTLWRSIAETNGINNPRRVAPGDVLAIPPVQAGRRL